MRRGGRVYQVGGEGEEGIKTCVFDERRLIHSCVSSGSGEGWPGSAASMGVDPRSGGPHSGRSRAARWTKGNRRSEETLVVEAWFGGGGHGWRWTGRLVAIFPGSCWVGEQMGKNGSTSETPLPTSSEKLTPVVPPRTNLFHFSKCAVRRL